jgi:hypothetical protein
MAAEIEASIDRIQEQQAQAFVTEKQYKDGRDETKKLQTELSDLKKKFLELGFKIELDPSPEDDVECQDLDSELLRWLLDSEDAEDEID